VRGQNRREQKTTGAMIIPCEDRLTVGSGQNQSTLLVAAKKWTEFEPVTALW